MKSFLFSLISVFAFVSFSPSALAANRFKDLQDEVAALKTRVESMAKKQARIQKESQDVSYQSDQTDKLVKQFRADNSVVIEDLRTEIGTLQGQIDLVKQEIENLKIETERANKDFDFRLSELESKKTAEATNPKKTKRRQSAESEYEELLGLIQNEKKYNEAISGLRDFIDNHPNNKLVPNAQYWIGESYYALGKYARSIKEFDVVVKKHSQSAKKCDALLKQGLGFEALRKPTETKLFYQEVINQCPKTTAAKQAQLKLAKIS